MSFRTRVSRLLSATPLACIPTKVRKGPAKGAAWTIAPFSSNWRHGGAWDDVEAALGKLDSITGIVFWDIGAHFGIHTVGVAMQVGPTGQVAAFEPDPFAFSKLSQHIRKNGLQNVKLFQAAASSASGTALLYRDQNESSSIGRLLPPNDERSGSSRVAAVALDDLVRMNQIRMPHIIKVDVEGHGVSVIKGAMTSIAAKLPIIAFSIHSHEESAGARALLEPLGYAAFALDGPPIVDWNTHAEFLLLPSR
jgi:FkbM family methyltransferase